MISRQSWLFRYKLYHLPFWFFYNYLLWVLATGSPMEAAHDLVNLPFFIKYLFYVIFPALAVYFNLYFLLPRYLEKGRYTEYVAFLLLTIAVTALCIVPGYYIRDAMLGKPEGESFFRLYFTNPVPATVATLTLAMSIKLAKNWVRTQKRQQLLEKEKLETELNFLRYQFNPHFLFNTINSIFFLIHKNPDMASASLAKFSDLLRYQLYECNDERILLSNEIAYLENFIELEKLRQNSNVEVSLQMNQRHTGHLMIAPFILMTFVENAFKHVSRHADQPNWIRIWLELDLDGEQVDFSVSNSRAQDLSNDVLNYGGIGLKNVQRRLDLIYPGLYELDIQSNNNRFEVRLRLRLGEEVAASYKLQGGRIAIS